MLNGVFGAPGLSSESTAVDVDRIGRAPSDTVFSENMMLNARLDALELACAGLWLFLKARHGYTDEDLAGVIQDLDARDGKVDGRMTPLQEMCPACGRKLATRQRKRCVWCGAELAKRPF